MVELQERWRELGTRVLLVVSSVVVALCLAECGLRVSGAAPLPETAAGGFRADHPLLRLLEPDSCRPFGRPEGAYWVEVCTNRLGLRDRNHAPAESPRVLALGDSFTFGWGVEQSDTFLAHLERALRLALPGKRPGVWNGGLSYTSQAHQAALLRYVYGDARPDLVVLGFAEDNDIDENIIWNPNIGVFPEQGEIPKTAVDAYREELQSVIVKDFLFRHFALVRFFRQRHVRASVAAEVSALETQLKAHGLSDAPLSRMIADEARRRFLQAFSSKYDDDWKVTEILLERIRLFLTERGTKLILLRVPSRISIEDQMWAKGVSALCGKDVSEVEKNCGTLDRGHTARRLAEYASRHGLAYVDPAEDLRAAVQRGEDVYLPEDIHLSRLGHLRLSERLAKDVLPAVGAQPPPVPAPNRTPKPSGARLVGAYYYPWYRAGDWRSFTDYTPKGGDYVSTDKATIHKQLHWVERGEIDFLIIELVADHNRESRFNYEAIDTLVQAIAERRRRGYSRLKFAILSDIFVGETEVKTNERWLELTREHLDKIWAKYVEPFPDAYVRLGGKPLLGIFSPPVAVDDARFAIFRPYWISHEQWSGWNRKHEMVPFWDTYPQTVTDSRFVSVTPGYNDWRLERKPQVAPYLPRRGGDTFVQQWRRVFEVNPEVVLVYSYNEYYEQTQLEPTLQTGDRYLLLNALFSRKYKDRQPLSAAEAERLAGILEPPARPGEEKAAWLSLADPRVRHHGLTKLADDRASLVTQGELEIEVESPTAYVIALNHAPSFERCAGLSVSIEGAESGKRLLFSTDLTQLAVLRELPQPSHVKRLKLKLAKVPLRPDCRDAGRNSIVLHGVTRYALETAERLNFEVHDPKLTLEGFWDIERPPDGSLAWSTARSTVTVTGLSPRAHYRATLTFRDTANFGNLELGTDHEHLKRLVITPGKTVTLPEPIVASNDGKLSVSLRTPTWRPSDLFGSKDKRALGVALRLVTLDRVTVVASPAPHR